MDHDMNTFLQFAAMVRDILEEPQIMLAVNLYEQVRRLHFGTSQANLISNSAVGCLGRTQFTQMDSSKLLLLSKVNVLNDVYESLLHFIDTAWGKLHHVVAALAMHNRLVIPIHLNTPHVIMRMIQDLMENSMGRSWDVHPVHNGPLEPLPNGFQTADNRQQDAVEDEEELSLSDRVARLDAPESPMQQDQDEPDQDDSISRERDEEPLLQDLQHESDNDYREDLHVAAGTAVVFLRFMGRNLRHD